MARSGDSGRDAVFAGAGGELGGELLLRVDVGGVAAADSGAGISGTAASDAIGGETDGNLDASGETSFVVGRALGACGAMRGCASGRAAAA